MSGYESYVMSAGALVDTLRAAEVATRCVRRAMFGLANALPHDAGPARWMSGDVCMWDRGKSEASRARWAHAEARRAARREKSGG